MRATINLNLKLISQQSLRLERIQRILIDLQTVRLLENNLNIKRTYDFDLLV